MCIMARQTSERKVYATEGLDNKEMGNGVFKVNATDVAG